MKKRPFKEKESYMHKYAKILLREWILEKPELIGLDRIVKVHMEERQCKSCFIEFTPDLTVYDKEGVKMFVEVVKSNPVSRLKFHRVKEYLKLHNWNNVYMCEVSAQFVLNQTERPNKLIFLSKNNLSWKT